MQPGFTIIGIVLILLLFIPGYFFKKFYYSNDFRSLFKIGDWAERFILIIFWGVIIQTLCLWMYHKIFDKSFIDILNNINLTYDSIKKDKIPEIDVKGGKIIIAYMASCVALSSIGGYFLYGIVRKLKLDIYLPFLAFNTPWYYELTGSTKDLLKLKRTEKKKIVYVEVDILTNQKIANEKYLMYSGIVSRISIAPKTGEIGSITLTNASRYSNSEKCIKEISGSAMIIPANTISNFNLRYHFANIDHSKRNLYIRNIVLVIVLCLNFIWTCILLPIKYYLIISIWSFIPAILISILVLVCSCTFVFGLFEILGNSKKNIKNGKHDLLYEQDRKQSIRATIVLGVASIVSIISLYSLLK